jgi:hypothetical protein
MIYQKNIEKIIFDINMVIQLSIMLQDNLTINKYDKNKISQENLLMVDLVLNQLEHVKAIQFEI